MNFLWTKTNWLIKLLFPKYVWDIPANEKTVYLTFDDGPIPEVTDWVLSQLNDFGAKATFFCIGDNARKNPDLLKRIYENGHSIGNHTFNHVNGWQTPATEYIANVASCEELLRKEIPHLPTKLFRPPYGKIKSAQAKLLRTMGFKIIMWDIISFDFDQKISPEECSENVIRNVRPGSIIVFHDSLKASQNMKHALSETLLFLKENGYKCEVIT